MAFSKARVERNLPRLSRRAVRIENQHSTKLIQEAEVGVKCRCTRGWMHIETYDVSHLVDEIRVGGEREAFGAMRRQGEGTPDARDGGLAQSQMGGERAGGPMGGILRHGLQGRGDHGLDLFVQDRARSA